MSTNSPASDRSSERGLAPQRNGPTRMGTETRHGSSLILPGAVRFLKSMHQTALEVIYLKKLAISLPVSPPSARGASDSPFPTRALQKSLCVIARGVVYVCSLK